MGSNVIVIATVLFLLFSAVVLFLMLYTMKRDVENRIRNIKTSGGTNDGNTENPS